MRCAILSDIHGNLEAFTAVLADIEKRGGMERIWCLGDVVGYGPDPAECIQLLRRYAHVCLAGNHDLGAIGKVVLTDFNVEAAAACAWTGSRLSPGEVEYLANLPLTITDHGFTLTHGSPREAVWEYVDSTYSAGANFKYFETDYCLVGHVHVPSCFELLDNGDCVLNGFPFENRLELERARLIINPGSVGQPRDGDPRASYAIYDSCENCIQHYRVQYDIQITQRKMQEQGLPARLISRLSRGW